MEGSAGTHLRGVVKCFYAERRFGFIVSYGNSYFAHISNVSDPSLILKEGQIVEFIGDRDKRGRLQAKRIRLVKSRRKRNRRAPNRPLNRNFDEQPPECSNETDHSSSGTETEESDDDSEKDSADTVEEFEILNKGKSGIIKSYNIRKGFGFIVGDNNKAIFFHLKNCLPFDHCCKLRSGCYVKYDEAKSKNRKVIEAINVINSTKPKTVEIENDKLNEKLEDLKIGSDERKNTNQKNDDKGLYGGVETVDERTNHDRLYPNPESAVKKDNLDLETTWLVRLKTDAPNISEKDDEGNSLSYLAHESAFLCPKDPYKKKNKGYLDIFADSENTSSFTQNLLSKSTHDSSSRKPEDFFEFNFEDDGAGDSSFLEESNTSSYPELSRPAVTRVTSKDSQSSHSRIRRPSPHPEADSVRTRRKTSSLLGDADVRRKLNSTSRQTSSVETPKSGTSEKKENERPGILKKTQSDAPLTYSALSAQRRVNSSRVDSAVGGSTRSKPAADRTALERRLSGRTASSAFEKQSSPTSDISEQGNPLRTSQTKPAADRTTLEQRLSGRTASSAFEKQSSPTSDISNQRNPLRTSQTKPVRAEEKIERPVTLTKNSEPFSASTTAYSYTARSSSFGERNSTVEGSVRSRVSGNQSLKSDINRLEKDYTSYLNLGDNTERRPQETDRRKSSRPTSTIINSVTGRILEAPHFSRAGIISTSYGRVSLPTRAVSPNISFSQLKPGVKIVFDMMHSENGENAAVNVVNVISPAKKDSSCSVS